MTVVKKCPFGLSTFGTGKNCNALLSKAAIEKIERLKKENEALAACQKSTEAYFAEQLKQTHIAADDHAIIQRQLGVIKGIAFGVGTTKRNELVKAVRLVDEIVNKEKEMKGEK